MRRLAGFFGTVHTPTKRYRILLGAIALPTIVTLPYACKLAFINVVDAPWVTAWGLASLTAILECFAEFRRPRPGRRKILQASIAVIIIFLLLALWVEWLLVPTLPPSLSFLRLHRARLIGISGCLIIYLTSLFLLSRIFNTSLSGKAQHPEVSRTS